MAVARNFFTSINAIQIPQRLRGYITVATATPYAGKELLLFSAYMPQITGHNKDLYAEILQWIHETTSAQPQHTPLLGGDFSGLPGPYLPILQHYPRPNPGHVCSPVRPAGKDIPTRGHISRPLAHNKGEAPARPHHSHHTEHRLRPQCCTSPHPRYRDRGIHTLHAKTNPI